MNNNLRNIIKRSYQESRNTKTLNNKTLNIIYTIGKLGIIITLIGSIMNFNITLIAIGNTLLLTMTATCAFEKPFIKFINFIYRIIKNDHQKKTDDTVIIKNTKKLQIKSFC